MNTEDMLTLTCCQDHILTEIYSLYGLKHHIVEMRRGVTDAGQPNERTVKILSQWKLGAEFSNWGELLGTYQTVIRATMRHYRSARQGKAQHFFAHIRVERTCIKRRPSYFTGKVFSIGRSVHPSVLLMNKPLVRLLSAYQGQSG